MDWGDLAKTALDIGANIYQGQLQKQAIRRAARASSPDFPQLGVGLAASGPQRGVLQPLLRNPFDELRQVGSIQIGPGGIYLGDSDESQVGGNAPARGGNMDKAVGPCRPRVPSIVYAIGQTPCGGQKLVAMRSAGTPLLWSGDFSAVKRVARVARKLGRFTHHRRPR
jgi:hypothetical protein